MECLSDLRFIEAASLVLARLEDLSALLMLPAFIFITGLLSLVLNYLFKPRRRIWNIPKVLFYMLHMALFFPKLILYGLLVIWIAAAAFSCIDAIIVSFFILTWMALGFYHLWERGFGYIDRMAHRWRCADSAIEEESEWIMTSELQAPEVATVKTGVLGRIGVVRKSLAQIEQERLRDAARRAGYVPSASQAEVPKLLAAPDSSPFWASRDPLKGTSFDPNRKK